MRYALLRDAMARTNRSGMATFVMLLGDLVQTRRGATAGLHEIKRRVSYRGCVSYIESSNGLNFASAALRFSLRLGVSRPSSMDRS